MRIRILAALVLVGSAAPIAEQARGGQVITKIDGTIGGFTLTSPNPNSDTSAVLAFPTITTTMFNGAAVNGFTTQLDNFVINRTPVDGPAGFTTFAVIPPGLTDAYQFRFVNLNPGAASFGLFGNSVTPPNFRPTAILIPNDPAKKNTLIVQTTGIPRRNSSDAYDFTQIETFTLVITAPDVDGRKVDLAAIIRNGGRATGAGTFALRAAPEPSTLTLAVLGAALGLGAFRRRRPMSPSCR